MPLPGTDLPSFVTGFLGASALGVAFLGGVKSALGAAWTARLNRQGDRLRAELTTAAGEIRHRQERELADFGLFTAKRHEVYAKAYALFDRMLTTTVELSQQEDEPPDYSGLTKNEAVQRLRVAQAPESLLAWVTATWDTANPDTRGDVIAHASAGFLRFGSVAQTVVRAARYMQRHSVYFSPPVRQQMRDIVRVYMETPEEESYDPAVLEPMVDRLRDLMQSELSGGVHASPVGGRILLAHPSEADQTFLKALFRRFRP